MVETKKTGLNREIEVLRNINAFGFLTTKSIANLTVEVAGDSALKSAKRVVRRLIKKKEILRRKSIEGINCFVLSEKGARRVADLCFFKKAKRGVELETRFAKRQEIIVSALVRIRNKMQGEIEVLGEIWLKRNQDGWFSGLHGIAWNKKTKKGIAVFFISSVRTETAVHVLNLRTKWKRHIEEIHLIAFQEETTQALLKSIKRLL